jgi:hypothetical protein
MSWLNKGNESEKKLRNGEIHTNAGEKIYMEN